MSKREYKNGDIFIPEPSHWLPLTENATDVSGNWGTLAQTGSITYSSNGAYFNGSSYLYKLLNEANQNFATIHIEFCLDTISNDIGTIFKIYKNTSNFMPIIYAKSWNQDINCAPYYNGNYGVLSITSVPLVAGQFFKATIRQNFEDGTSNLFINGELRTTCNLVIPKTLNFPYLYIGRNNSDDRYFKGYIRNIKTFSQQLTDEQIAVL